MSEITVRRARRGDIDDIYAVTYASWQDTYADILPDDFLESMQPPAAGVPDDQRDWLETAIAHDGVTEFVATDDDNGTDGDGTVVGFAETIWATEHTRDIVDDSDAGLRALYLDPDYHHRGIGTRLLERAVETLPRRIDRVAVGVLAANDDARRFYEANGFERVGSTTFEVNGNAFPECLYARAV